MSNQWFVHAEGKQSGPLSPAELKQLVEQGQVTAETPVRLGVEGKWVRAGRVKGLLPGVSPSANAVKEPPVAHSTAPVERAGNSAPPVRVPSRAKAQPREPSAQALPGLVPPAVPKKARRQPAAAPAERTASRRVSPSPGGRQTARDLGIGGLILGMAGIAAFWLPMLGLPLSAIGVLVGLSGLVCAVVQRRGGIWISAASIVVATLVFCLGWAYGPEPDPDLATIRKNDATADGARQAETAALIEKAESEWANFSPDVEWLDHGARGMLGDVEVQIESVKMDYPTFDDLGEVAKSETPLLTIRLWIRNTSRSTSNVYRGWSGAGSLTDSHAAKLLDHRELTIRPPDLRPGTTIQGQLVNQSISPGEQVPDLLVFVPPTVAFDFLLLELPGEAVGAPGALHFRIPADFVQKVEPEPGALDEAS